MFENLLYFIFVHLSLLIPGYVFVTQSGLIKSKPGFQLSLGYAASIVLFALLATCSYVLKIDPLIIRILCWGILVATLWLFIYKRLYRNLYTFRFPLTCLILMSLLSLAFIGLNFSAERKYIPDPTPLPNRNYSVLNVKVLNVAQTVANDNYIPYRQAQFFVNRSNPAKDSFINEWGVSFFQRTPLMGAVVANYFLLIHDKPPIDYTWSASSSDTDHTYEKFQIIAQVLNVLFIIPAFLFLERLFNKKTAVVSCLFLVTSQFFIYNAFFSWPKSLVAFFILISWALLLEKRLKYTLLAAVISGLAYLAHDLAILYIGASFIYLLWDRRVRELIIFSLTAFALAVPWLITSSLIFHKTSSFIYFPFSTTGVPQTSNGKEILSNFIHTSPLTHLKIRVSSLLYLISPYQLFTSEGGQLLGRRLWALGLYSIPGAVGIGLLIPMYTGIIKRFRAIPLWLFSFAPVILAVLLVGWKNGLGALHFAETIVVLLTGLATFYLLSLKNTYWLLIAYIANAIQLGFFIGYSYAFHWGVWIKNAGDLVRIAFILIVIIAAGYVLNISRKPDSLDRLA